MIHQNTQSSIDCQQEEKCDSPKTLVVNSSDQGHWTMIVAIHLSDVPLPPSI